MNESILLSTKKVLGISADYDVFDVDIIMHINTILSILTQLGLGPQQGFQIVDSNATWTDFIGKDPKRNAVQTYIYLRTRILFDPPTSSYLITALNEQIRELEWRLNVEREETEWTNPWPTVEAT